MKKVKVVMTVVKTFEVDDKTPQEFAINLAKDQGVAEFLSSADAPAKFAVEVVKP